MSFEVVSEFEQKIAEFYGAPFAIAVDCCTHGIELCLRHQNVKSITVPKRTYLSIPFLADKLGIELIMYGEDGEVEYGGTSKTQNKFLYDNKYVDFVDVKFC